MLFAVFEDFILNDNIISSTIIMIIFIVLLAMAQCWLVILS